MVQALRYLWSVKQFNFVIALCATNMSWSPQLPFPICHRERASTSQRKRGIPDGFWTIAEGMAPECGNEPSLRSWRFCWGARGRARIPRNSARFQQNRQLRRLQRSKHAATTCIPTTPRQCTSSHTQAVLAQSCFHTGSMKVLPQSCGSYGTRVERQVAVAY